MSEIYYIIFLYKFSFLLDYMGVLGKICFDIRISGRASLDSTES